MNETSGHGGACVTLVLDHLTALGGCYRGDWNGFDGRTLRAQLDDMRALLEGALAGEDITEAVRRDRLMNRMCPLGGSHWTDYCADYGCAPASSDSGASGGSDA